MGKGAVVMRDYATFLNSKSHLSGEFGFDPTFMPDVLFPFQKDLVRWATVKGRCATFADTGLGKTFMQLTVAQNVVERGNGNVLLLTPLAVGAQTLTEASKLGVAAARSSNGKVPASPCIVIANYERLHYFDPNDFVGVVCDESSILKNYDGAIKSEVTRFMLKVKWRFLYTATAAPNDFIELGTSAEAIGELGYMDMLARFFKKDTSKVKSRKDENRKGVWRFRGHAERDFWRWVCSWSRAIRKPSDMGYDDGGFNLPPLITNQHVITANEKDPEWLFALPAIGLAEQRKERSRTVEERCAKAAHLINAHSDPAIGWCYLNKESNLLAKLIPGSVEVTGNDSDEEKEEYLMAFANGEIRVLITKPRIAGRGLNFQHCAHQTYFPSHSFEEWYQSLRRCWRFGQKRPVVVDMITSEGESQVLGNLQRKAEAADEMFANLLAMMNNEMRIQKREYETTKIQIPAWL
jgi:hypothetical protein